MSWRLSLIALLIGFILDLILGDPHTPYHPICLIGNTIAFFEKTYRKVFPKTETGELLAGACLVVTVLIISTGVPLVILLITYKVNVYLGLVIETLMSYTILATKSLKDESMKVYYALKDEGLEAGRKAVSMIVGRDTIVLDEEGVAKAAVETVAENFSDGVVAPMFFMILGGAVGGFFYKAINTMDSMVGYKNKKYLYMGRMAAYLDDVVNFIPARLSALFMILGAFVCGLDGENAIRIFNRDRYKHASPNSAQTESVAAGALHLMLAGDAWYFGELHHKDTIGDNDRPIEKEDIRVINKLMYISAFIAIIHLSIIKGIIIMLMI